MPDGCEVHDARADRPTTCVDALEALADALGATGASPGLAARDRPDRPTGPLTGRQGRRRPSARSCPRARSSPTRRSRRARCSRRTRPAHRARLAHAHRRRDRPGAAGRGRRGRRLPRPAGASPRGRRQRDVHDPVAVDAGARAASTSPTIIFNNRSYAILNLELARVGAQQRRAQGRRTMLDLSRPDLDFVSLGHGLGVAAHGASTPAEDLVGALATCDRRARPAPDRGGDPGRVQSASASSDAARDARARGDAAPDRPGRQAPAVPMSAMAGARWATFDCYGTLVDWNAGIARRARAGCWANPTVTACFRVITRSSPAFRASTPPGATAT